MRMQKLKCLSLVLIVFVLSGCMYPGDTNDTQEVPYADQLETIQKAVYQYQEATGGLLPIKTRDMTIDMYIKYPIEFSKIIPTYTEKIPSNAFETGGIYQYVLMDVEDQPTVKLVDLRAAERLRELNIRKNINGYVPFGDSVGINAFAVDFKKMGFDKPVTIESPYSQTQLPIVVGGDGNFYVDYTIDLSRILKEQKVNVEEGQDIRFLLTDNYPVLPAYSLPYTVNDKNEPIFMKKNK